MNLSVLKDEKLTTARVFWQDFQNAELVKYTPHKRCLFRVKIKRSDYFVKLYPKKFLKGNRGEKIHLVGKEFWKLAKDKRLKFKVPTPVFWDEATLTLWQKRLAGTPAVEFVRKGQGEKLAFQIGKSIARISDLEITPLRFFDSTEQMKDSRDFGRKIAERFPQVRPRLRRLLKLLAAAHQSHSAQNLVRSHGDMHFDQWLFDGKSLGLLDFEDFSFAEQERDLAFFVVHAEATFASDICVAAIERWLIYGFESSGKALDKKLFEIYKAHKWLARAAKVSEEPQADGALEKAFECLDKI